MTSATRDDLAPKFFRPLRTRLVQVTLDGVIVMVSSLRH